MSEGTELILRPPLLRERELLGLTQHDVAEELGVSRNFILRAESGEYPEPPKNLVEYYAGGDKTQFALLMDQYKAYQTRQRLESFGMLYPYFTEPEEFLTLGGPDVTHPLLYWIRRTVEIDPEAPGISVDKGGNYPRVPTLYAICRAFCVHHAVMYHWTHEVATVKAVPKIFLAALFESGYSETCLIALEGAYRLHREALIGDALIRE